MTFGVSFWRFFLYSLDSDTTKITRRMCGPRENMQHRWDTDVGHRYGTGIYRCFHFTANLHRHFSSLLFFFFFFFLPQVTFPEEDLPREDCEYLLGYFSHNMNSIVGLSTPVQVTPAQSFVLSECVHAGGSLTSGQQDVPENICLHT